MVQVKSIILSQNTFTNNSTTKTSINSVDLSNIVWENNSMENSFNGCTSLTSITNINGDVVNMSGTFDGCTSLTGDIYIDAENITNAINCFNNTGSNDKNVYIPFEDNNGDESETLKSFRNAGYSDTIRSPINGVLLMSDPLRGWNYESLTNGTNLLKRYVGSKTFVLVPNQNSELYDGGGFGNLDLANIPFAFNNNVEIVNLNDVPFTNNSAVATFYGCQNLTTVTNINSNVTDLFGTFTECGNLENVPSIPNTVTNMYYVFYNCQKLQSAPAIPELVINISEAFSGCTNLTSAPDMSNATSVEDMSYTFNKCSKLQSAPNIPSSVTNMSNTFRNCTNLTSAPDMSNATSVEDMGYTFYNCTSLTSAPDMSNATSVEDMSYTFSECYSLQSAPNIPSSVTNMFGTFVGCQDLSGNVYIHSEDITNAYYCFGQTSGIKEVYIPFNTTQQHIITKWYCWKNSNDVSYYTKTDFYNITQGTSGYSHEQLYNDSFIEDGGLEYRNYGEPTYERYYYDVESGKDAYETMTYSSADNIVITKEIGDSSLTYDAFVEAGYSESERKDGVLLHDINSL